MNNKRKLPGALIAVGVFASLIFAMGCAPNIQPVDYSNQENWLCYDGSSAQSTSSDLCDRDLSATVVNSDGTTSIEPHVKAVNPDIDCFYLYPTVSADLTGNSDLNDNAEENLVALGQVARYSSLCRIFAPVYRQTTLATIFTGLQGDSALAYADVLDAFNYYLTNENNGRGFILIGHSQGSGHSGKLIREEIEPNQTLKDQLISAHLLGSRISAPTGTDVGGTFQSIPACRTPTDIGCVVTLVSYRDSDPFLAAGTALFGRAEAGSQALCTLPGALSGGAAALNAYFPVDSTPLLDTLLIKHAEGAFADPQTAPTITTAFYTMPGFLTGECKLSNDGVSYMEVTMNPDPQDPRADSYNGEFTGGDGWGLHLVDITLVMGNLVALAEQQTQSWLSSQ